jgi:hypothetical protein
MQFDGGLEGPLSKIVSMAMSLVPRRLCGKTIFLSWRTR